ncbi:hypothetical protein [Arundinibacter roseus]|uniref:Uncharacterized protein n=1 Tax=Arundinibacter roseus TaxID=2070510 RepID=A0A4V2XAW1_9BACT|nr:hypothetical protein [Arundinibacter roseus]TDB69115.1 hypothetical protein EZE20_01910 [Arundinibacter roseus]
MNNPLHIIDLLTLNAFFEAAAAKIDGLDAYHFVSSGEDGAQEIQHLFEKSITPGQRVLIAQIAETPLTDNATGLTRATFACSVMVLQKMAGIGLTALTKLEARNSTWKQILRMIGFVRTCAEYTAATATDNDEVEFRIYQDRLLPIGRIANAQVQGWLIEMDVTIPVNAYLFSE